MSPTPTRTEEPPRTAPAGDHPGGGPVDGATFRAAMSLLAAPLTVVTTTDAAGRRWGFTAGSVTSASLDPPLVLAGMAHGSSCRPAFEEATEYVINILAERHTDVAGAFSTRGIDRFAGHPFEDWPGSRLPRLAGAQAALRCRLVDRVPVGDHHFLVGELTGLHCGPPARPLLWHRRDFCTGTETTVGDEPENPLR